jgi:hypothetical protein
VLFACLCFVACVGAESLALAQLTIAPNPEPNVGPAPAPGAAKVATPEPKVKGAEATLAPEIAPTGHSRLEEVSPLVDDVEIVRGDPYIEVFVKGTGHLACYDVREFVVEKLPHETRIIPRLRRSKPKEPCPSGLMTFRDKAADLDPTQPSSKRIAVLGFRGWHYRTLDSN